MEDANASKALAFLRVVFGILLVLQVLPNLDYSFIERLPEQVDAFALENPYPAYRWLLHRVAAPNVETVGAVLSVGQFLVGLALVLGFLIRLTAALGVVYAMNLVIAAGHLSFFHQGLGVLLLLIFVTLMLGDAGRYYGVDGWIFKKGKPEHKPSKPRFKDKKQKDVVDSLNKAIKTQTGKKRKSKPQPSQMH